MREFSWSGAAPRVLGGAPLRGTQGPGALGLSLGLQPTSGFPGDREKVPHCRDHACFSSSHPFLRAWWALVSQEEGFSFAQITGSGCLFICFGGGGYWTPPPHDPTPPGGKGLCSPLYPQGRVWLSVCLLEY